jgi:DNA-binding transcriptional LysR family regulator
MELRDLRYFCLVAETGSVTRAADTLCVSQPFVTKVIHRLEEELGTKLFDLEKRRVVLNQNGEYFYRHAREILDKLDRLTEDMAAMQEQAEFTTTLLYNNAGYLSALNSAFMAQYPHSVLSETYAKRSDIIDLLNTNKADFAIALPPITGEESRLIETITVLKDTGSIMVPPDHPLYEKEFVTLEEIAPYPIVIAPKGSGMRDTIDHIFERHGLTPNVVYETNDMDLQQRAVLVDKRGIAFMSIIHTKDPLIGQYCRKTLTDQCFGTVGLSYNKFRPETVSTRAFKQFVLEFFGKLQSLADSI